MRLSLAIENGCIESEADYIWIHDNNATFKSDLASLITADYTFVILRCPYARLASVFLDKIAGAEPAGIKFSHMAGVAGGAGNVTFESFIWHMQHPEIKRGNVHWRPQCDFLVYKQYDDYFCLESFDFATTVIVNKTGMKICPASALTRHGLDMQELVDTGDYSSVRAADILAMKLTGKCPSPRRLYNDDLIKIVNAAFAEDIALYRRHFGDGNLMFST